MKQFVYVNIFHFAQCTAGPNQDLGLRPRHALWTFLSRAHRGVFFCE